MQYQGSLLVPVHNRESLISCDHGVPGFMQPLCFDSSRRRTQITGTNFIGCRTGKSNTPDIGFIIGTRRVDVINFQLSVTLHAVPLFLRNALTRRVPPGGLPDDNHIAAVPPIPRTQGQDGDPS